ncbi:MAG: NAD(P)-dependent oxidoreductase [Nitratireductor sp.]|nr:NAD(P)-dependent oxidoreductase [Nitratireductor sp.]
MARPVIGFIGVGLMGHGMARNIVDKGYELMVMGHRNRAPVEDLVRRGAREAANPAELARQCDIVHLCVTGSPQVEAIVRASDGLIASGREGLIVVDCSTSDPVSTLQLAGELAAANMVMVDAPLSRTPKEAEAGTLDTMVGADPQTFETIRPVLECWAAVITHLGPVGLGHKMKLVNNFIAMGYAAIYSEALAIARKNGLSADQFNSVVAPGRMACGFYETFMKWTLERDPEAHKFTISNAHKDMRYLANMANASGSVNAIQAVVKNAFAAMEADGQGDKYVPMLADFIAGMNGLDNPEK